MNRFTIVILIFATYVGVNGLVSMFSQNFHFNYLLSAFLVAVLVYYFYGFAERARPVPNNCIKTPYPIVYRNCDNSNFRASFYCLPYLDLLRSEYVWGFEVSGMKICKDEDEPSGWEKAKISNISEKFGRECERLPEAEEMLVIGCNMNKINKTICILKENNIKADNFKYGKYWCTDVSIWGNVKPKVIYPQAGNFLKIIRSRYQPKNLNEVFFVRKIV